jgi:hypothetical protein
VQLACGGLAHFALYGRETHAAFFQNLPVFKHAGVASATTRALPVVLAKTD